MLQRAILQHHCTINNTNSWIKCDDKDVSVNENPKKGLVFIFDKIDNNGFLSTATIADE